MSVHADMYTHNDSYAHIRVQHTIPFESGKRKPDESIEFDVAQREWHSFALKLATLNK